MNKVLFQNIYFKTYSILLDDNGYIACIWLALHVVSTWVFWRFYLFLLLGFICDTWPRANPFFHFFFSPQVEEKKRVQSLRFFVCYQAGVYCVLIIYFNFYRVCKLEMGVVICVYRERKGRVG
jgi:hypothetical protein